MNFVFGVNDLYVYYVAHYHCKSQAIVNNGNYEVFHFIYFFHISPQKKDEI